MLILWSWMLDNPDTSVSVSGVSATGFVGNVTVALDCIFPVTGVSCTGYVGRVLVWNLVNTAQTPNWADMIVTQSPAWAPVSTGVPGTWTDVVV